MTLPTQPTVGEIYERDGLQREVVKIVIDHYSQGHFDVVWRRPGKTQTFKKWCHYWCDWAKKAKKIA